MNDDDLDELPPDSPASPTRRTLLGGGAALGSWTVTGLALPAFAQADPGTVPSTVTVEAPAPFGPTVPTRIGVNGTLRELDLDPRASLLDVLREQLALTGAKKGCDHGQCGACTVHVDGRRVASCLTLAVKMDGREVLSVEGLSDGERLHPMQQAFIDHDALQCGYCTPGQITMALG